MSNRVRCCDCVNFEKVEKIVNGKRVAVSYGYCKAKSTYPAPGVSTAQLPDEIIQSDDPTNVTGMVAVPNGEHRMPLGGSPIVPDCLMAIKK